MINTWSVIKRELPCPESQTVLTCMGHKAIFLAMGSRWQNTIVWNMWLLWRKIWLRRFDTSRCKASSSTMGCFWCQMVCQQKTAKRLVTSGSIEKYSVNVLAKNNRTYLKHPVMVIQILLWRNRTENFENFYKVALPYHHR